MRNDLQLTPFDSGSDGLDYQSPARSMGNGQMGNGQTGNDADGKSGDIYKRMHMMLRGRYKFVLPLAVIMGLCGAIAGYKSQKPMYESVGLIVISPSSTNPLNGDDKEIKLYSEFLENQVLVITSRAVIDKAMQDPEWLKVGRPYTPAGIKQFVDCMDVEHPERSQSLRIAFQDRDPEVARIAAKAILDAYESVFKDLITKEDAKQMNIMETFKRDLAHKYQDLDAELLKDSKVNGTTDVSPLYDTLQRQVADLEVRLTNSRLALDLARKSVNPEDAINSMTPRQIAMLDDRMRALRTHADEVESQWRLMRARLGPNNPNIAPYQVALDDANKAVDDYAQDWRNLELQKSHNPSLAESKDALFGIAASTAQQNVDSIQKSYDDTKSAMITLGNLQQEMQRLIASKSDMQKQIDDVDKRMDMRRRESSFSDLLQRPSEPQTPYSPSKDRRIHMAGLFGMAGFMLPLVILGFGAMIDKRYRYSDEASQGIGQTPLLGILPTLPDKLEDPEQASIAAHCIHQIRIMLQMGREDQTRRTFMFTSASTGDGKTSMALALGLSFASSGARTLLVDADIIGQGLSHRMRMSDFTGLCETIQTGTMQGHVQKSINKGLWVLPIGNSDDFNAGMMSPLSIRKLIAEAKQHFDYILIDTGPALGSLEASLVAPEVDNVVIAVSRGQNQVLVERTLAHLRSMGAKIGGIVFNRAEKRDFHRSVVSSSIRSLSAKPSTPRGLLPDSEENARLGPLARSVVSFLPTTGQGDVRA